MTRIVAAADAVQPGAGLTCSPAPVKTMCPPAINTQAADGVTVLDTKCRRADTTTNLSTHTATLMRPFPLLLALAFAGPVAAADPPQTVKDAEWHKQLTAQLGKGTRRALLIAIDEYLPPENPLHCCGNDAALLSEVLHRFCGYERDNIVVLANKDATRPNVLKKLADLVAVSKPEDALFVSYGGHGTLLGGRSFMCTYDMDGKNPAATGVGMDEVRDLLQSKKIAQKILYLDTCHSGGATAVKINEPSTQELAGAFEKASGLITLAGCRRNQCCIDYQKHGVFTGQFARGLAGEADFDKNGVVDSDEIYRHLIMEVPPTAKLADPRHEQVPVRIIGEDVVGVFALAKPGGGDTKLLGKLPARPTAGDRVENAAGMKLIYLPSDVIVVGSPRTEYLRNDDEPQQPVAVTTPIYMGVHEVTQDQYRTVVGKNPSSFSADGPGADAVAGLKTGAFPVEQVSWDDAVAFCAKLSALPAEKAARRGYRLPTECEWEFACRAGTNTVFSTGDKLSSKQANVRGDKTYLDSDDGPTLGRPAAVGSYRPNAFGLHDMHGNVAEWCQDYYSDRRFPALAAKEIAGYVNQLVHASQKEKEWGEGKSQLAMKELACPHNPTGPGSGTTRVYRGGAFTGDVAFARSACRRDKDPDYAYRGIGFRVVCYLTAN